LDIFISLYGLMVEAKPGGGPAGCIQGHPWICHLLVGRQFGDLLLGLFKGLERWHLTRGCLSEIFH